MINKRYKVKGMSCMHCVAHVKSAVEELDGVESAEVSLEKESLDVKYDENIIGYEDIRAAVEEAGYGLDED